MHNSNRTRGWTIVTLAIVLVSGFGVAPAAARQDPGTPAGESAGQPDDIMDARLCPLTRIGTQFVRCDNLTGAGVGAPAWAPES